ncbi:hypothetical protein FYK55_28365 [Roseiconus nitratireducens]|uniref:Uncharacterized protein n=1 Tax=Roseiconus nitratireducens TaxID=2605748 RepID=A0A5M6CMP0_9BACT|nr:hypothetical protein FYK55_28365 [Roseiconus nitratireducens]
MQQWLADMQRAVDGFCGVSSQLLTRHRAASEEARQVEEQWRLGDRLREERSALNHVIRDLHSLLTKIDALRISIRCTEDFSVLAPAMRETAEQIESVLPSLQADFLTIRHSALDLLRWEKRFAHIEDSDLPAQYRERCGQLLSYTPLFRPALEAMQRDLLERSKRSKIFPELQALLAALNHYNVAIESARGFVQSVVNPPMDLVFHETEQFLTDWDTVDTQQRAELATVLNDSCQLLLYDQAGFRQAVQEIQHPVSDGVDSSLYVLPDGRWRIILAVDEDPVFAELIVTLLRLVPNDRLEPALQSVMDGLYRDFSPER